MEKLNRYLSFELLFALLFIVAFSLPWLDMGLIKAVGWDIPGIQKKMAQVTNIFKIFSKNKESLYFAYVVYLIPLLSIVVISLWILLKQKAGRVVLMITGIFGFIVSLNLFYKLPKAGSGVYLLCATSILSIIYLIIVFRRKKKVETGPIETPPNSPDPDIIE
ncbi:MAG: hypothetical protein E6767_16625 [Dysgonomonas sp.]|nr:hypothetical protein [Dysgonomonas sp.]